MGTIVQRVSGVAAWNVIILRGISYLTGIAMSVISQPSPYSVIAYISLQVMGAGDGGNIR